LRDASLRVAAVVARAAGIPFVEEDARRRRRARRGAVGDQGIAGFAVGTVVDPDRAGFGVTADEDVMLGAEGEAEVALASGAADLVLVFFAAEGGAVAGEAREAAGALVVGIAQGAPDFGPIPQIGAAGSGDAVDHVGIAGQQLALAILIDEAALGIGHVSPRSGGAHGHRRLLDCLVSRHVIERFLSVVGVGRGHVDGGSVGRRWTGGLGVRRTGDDEGESEAWTDGRDGSGECVHGLSLAEAKCSAKAAPTEGASAIAEPEASELAADSAESRRWFRCLCGCGWLRGDGLWFRSDPR